MARTTTPPGDLQQLEEQALKSLEEEGLRGLEEEAPEPEKEVVAELPRNRLALVTAFPVLAAAVMTGGMFIGLGARFWAAVGGLLGIYVGLRASRIRKAGFMWAVIVAGVLLSGVLLIVPSGFGNLFDLGGLVKEAIVKGDIRRPPVEFDPGWRAIVGWMMAGLGFVTVWIAVEIKRPALAVLVPLPIIAITAISVADEAKVVSGLVCLFLFVVGLGVLSGTELEGDQESRPSVAYELRRGLKAIPMIAVIIGLLYFASTSGLLFPPPLYDPTQEAKKPKTVPLAEVVDRVLFRAKANFSGPWRMGHLDVYDGVDWRLPPFAQSQLAEVPRSGVVDSELTPGIKAEFEIVELGGAVLPGLPNTVGVIAEGPRLAFDSRLGNIRLAEGTIQPGLKYTVVAGIIPPIDELRQVTAELPDDIDGVPTENLLDIPKAPPAVQALLDAAPTTSAWDRFDHLRTTFLDTVVASGSGVPVEVRPNKVDDMLTGSKEGTPFEIVAAQAMLARWAGIPSRIGYGFDGGEEAGEFIEVRPKHGASFLEVYFPTYKWLPVIGTPRQAKTAVGNDPQQFNPNVLSSNEIAVKLFVPVALDPANFLFVQIRRILAIVVPTIALMLAAYYFYPALRKGWIRSRRRAWAAEQGPAERIALSYAEWRDVATDFGYLFEADTPLMFLDRVVEDEEHIELAWLVTRSLWGDMKNNITLDDANAAEEMSRSLKRRLAQAHPWTLRSVSALSRLSLRHAYAPSLGSPKPKEEAGEPAHAA